MSSPSSLFSVDSLFYERSENFGHPAAETTDGLCMGTTVQSNYNQPTPKTSGEDEGALYTGLKRVSSNEEAGEDVLSTDIPRIPGLYVFPSLLGHDTSRESEFGRVRSAPHTTRAWEMLDHEGDQVRLCSRPDTGATPAHLRVDTRGDCKGGPLQLGNARPGHVLYALDE